MNALGLEKYANNPGDFYFFTGYAYTHLFLNHHSVPMVSISSPSFSADPIANQTFANSFHGILVGAGIVLAKYLEMQLWYDHDFIQKRNTTIRISTQSNQFRAQSSLSIQSLFLEGYVPFNPDSRYEVGMKVGISLSNYKAEVLIPSNGAIFKPLSDTTEINPNIGMTFTFKIMSQLSASLEGLYTPSFYHRYNDGNVKVLLTASYWVRRD